MHLATPLETPLSTLLEIILTFKKMFRIMTPQIVTQGRRKAEIGFIPCPFEPDPDNTGVGSVEKSTIRVCLSLGKQAFYLMRN